MCIRCERRWALMLAKSIEEMALDASDGDRRPRTVVDLCNDANAIMEFLGPPVEGDHPENVAEAIKQLLQ